MAKQVGRVQAVNVGTVIDVLPGDIIKLVRERSGVDTVLTNKQGQALSKTIPAGAVVDAAALEFSLTIILRSIDASTMTNAQKAALLDLVNNGTLKLTDDDPFS